MDNKYVQMRCDLNADLEMGQTLPNGIVLMPLQDVSEDALYAVYHAAFSTGDAAFFFAQSEEERRDFFGALELGQAVGQNVSLALLKGDELVAFTFVLPYGEKNLHISCMCVHPDYKRQGLGKFMLQHAQRQARVDGFRSMALGTDTLMGAYQLYAKNGFEVVA